MGAYSNQPQAIAQIKATQEAVRAVAETAGREVNIADGGAKAVYRARFTKLTETEALLSCNLVKESGDDCIAMQLTR